MGPSVQKWRSEVPRILAHHGLDPTLDPNPPKAGNVCEAYFTGSVVLKIPRQRWRHTTAIEIDGSAVGRAAGVKVPSLVASGRAGDLISEPYTIWARIAGSLPQESPQVWRMVGREIAVLHDRAPLTGRETTKWGGPLQYLGPAESRLRARGVWEQISCWSRRVSPALATPTTMRFLHADVHERNVIVDADGNLAALVDWGDAGVGDAAYDLARAPIAMLPSVLEGYEEALDRRQSADITPRILAHRLARIVRFIGGNDLEPWDLPALLRFGTEAPRSWRDALG